MAKHKLNHRRKKKIERHRARVRAACALPEESPGGQEPWYWEDGGLLAIDWGGYDWEYWSKHDYSMAGQNALKIRSIFEDQPVPWYEESRKRRLATKRKTDGAALVGSASV